MQLKIDKAVGVSPCAYPAYLSKGQPQGVPLRKLIFYNISFSLRTLRPFTCKTGLKPVLQPPLCKTGLKPVLLCGLKKGKTSFSLRTLRLCEKLFISRKARKGRKVKKFNKIMPCAVFLTAKDTKITKKSQRI